MRPPIVGLYELQCSPVAGTADEGDASARCCVERVLFAFGPMLRVLSMCRGVVAADATHLTGTFKSTLYVIVGKDASNHLVPCSYMLSWRSETSDDWVTFLTKMQPLMPHVQVCISDHQKGLLEGVAAARWRHSRCVLHMLRNMRGHGICGSLRARDVAILARQCRATDYNYVLHTILTERVPERHRDRAAGFLQQHQRQYSGVFFVPEFPRYGDTLNNAAECFNSVLVQPAPGQPRLKDMGWLSVLRALRKQGQRWHAKRYAGGSVTSAHHLPNARRPL